MINMKLVKEMQKQLKTSQKIIAKERDKLRDMLDEYECLTESSSEVLINLECAVDELSKFL